MIVNLRVFRSEFGAWCYRTSFGDDIMKYYNKKIDSEKFCFILIRVSLYFREICCFVNVAAS